MVFKRYFYSKVFIAALTMVLLPCCETTPNGCGWASGSCMMRDANGPVYLDDLAGQLLLRRSHQFEFQLPHCAHGFIELSRVY